MQILSPLPSSFLPYSAECEVVNFTLLKTANERNFPMKLPIRLEQVISSKVLISELVEVVAKGAGLDGLMDVLASSSADARQVSFQFEGETYILENGDDENDHRVLLVKNSQGQVLANVGNSSLGQLRDRLILLSIFMKLSSSAKAVFQPVFDIQKIGQVDAKSPLVAGDLDGSMARLVVLGIQAGIMGIDPEGCEILAWLINAEALVMEKVSQSPVLSPIRVFQSDTEVQEATQLLHTHLTYGNGHTKLIFIGDVVYDRFASDIRTSLELCRSALRNGAEFITGNHDVLLLSEWDLNRFEQDVAVSFGGFANYAISDQECVAYQNEIFSNAYYHQETNKLYLHHGLEEKDGRIYTAFGMDSYPLPLDATTFDVEKFVEWMNRQPRPLPESLLTDPSILHKNAVLDARLTGFRPDEEAMGQLARKIGVEIVHGHSGNMAILSDDVIVLNARRQNRQAVVAAYVGKSDASIERKMNPELIHNFNENMTIFMGDLQILKEKKQNQFTILLKNRDKSEVTMRRRNTINSAEFEKPGVTKRSLSDCLAEGQVQHGEKKRRLMTTDSK